MLYEYECSKCKERYELHRKASEYKDPSNCPHCGTLGGGLIISGCQFFGAKVEDAEYNYGLGCVTKSAKHRAEIAKRKNLVEIGNDCKPADMIANEEKRREQRSEETWNAIK